MILIINEFGSAINLFLIPFRRHQTVVIKKKPNLKFFILVPLKYLIQGIDECFLSAIS